MANEICTLSDAELDEVGGGFGLNLNINTNVSNITQVNAVGIGGWINQSNQAVNLQANQSYVSAWLSLYSSQH
jgi:hypothetical protein